MRILKAVCHLGVDQMLKAALGDQLTIWRCRTPEGKPKDLTFWVPSLPFDTVDSVENDGWDVVIYDDIPTRESLRNIKARAAIWYVHGTYHTWRGFQIYANEHLQNVHVLFPDLSRRRHVMSWYQHQPLSELILPVHLSSQYFTPVPQHRNGRCFVMGNELKKTIALYGGLSLAQVVLCGLQWYPFDFFGYGLEDLVPQEFYRGVAYPIRDTVVNHSVSVNPSLVETLGFVLLECMASGVPIITTPKINLPEELSGRSYVIARTPAQFLEWSEKLVRDEALSITMGNAGQKFLREVFPFASYQGQLKEWLAQM